jgi:2-methylisocitrate lyase-like PEP mutase family enzyme
MDQQSRARTFRALHTGDVLVLPNAWDAASARVIEHAGAAAIATTSAGVSWSGGVPDGQRLDLDAAMAALHRIGDAVRVPVTADIEGGYAEDAPRLADAVRRTVAAGAVGINIEDARHDDATLRGTQEQADRIRTVRRAALSTGIDLFVNARTDTFLVGADDALAESLHRARAYLDAGADGIFVPGVTDPDTIAALVRGIAAPLNVMAGPGAPPVAALAALGVARVSVGMGIAQAAYALAGNAARELLDSGTYEHLAGGLSYQTLNGLLAGSVPAP